MDTDVLFKYLENILNFKISLVIFANGRNFGPFWLFEIAFTERLEYGCFFIVLKHVIRRFLTCIFV